MATLTTGGLVGDDPLGNGSSFVRPVGHKIYVPMETSFANVTRLQARLDDDDKRQIPPPTYDTSFYDPPTNSNNNNNDNDAVRGVGRSMAG